VFAAGDPSAYLVPDEALTAFMNHCSSRVGDAYFRTPRTTIKEFVNLLAVLDQNPGTNWNALIGTVELAAETNPDLLPLPTDAEPDPASAAPYLPPPVDQGGAGDDLATFRL
jgi:hypothetical protein